MLRLRNLNLCIGLGLFNQLTSTSAPVTVNRSRSICLWKCINNNNFIFARSRFGYTKNYISTSSISNTIIESKSISIRPRSTMPLKFAANLSFMFTEYPSLESRYEAAQKAGFKYVEFAFPYDEDMEVLKNAKEKAGLEQVLINGFPGDLKSGDIGFAAHPGREQEFKEKLELSISYAKALGCKRMHIMSGRVPNDADNQLREKMMETFISNITYAAERLQRDGILALIEAVNDRISMPGYFMSNPLTGLEIVKKVNHPNLKFQFDIFHVQIMDGNLTKNIEKFLPHIGHIQIAQVPERGEPDTPGEINYQYVFSVLENLGYDGFIGLEYKPRGKTEDGLEWLRKLGV